MFIIIIIITVTMVISIGMEISMKISSQEPIIHKITTMWRDHIAF